MARTVGARSHRVAIVVAVAAVVALVGACGARPDSVTGQARAGDRKGYVSGDGSVEQISESKRAKPLTVTGTTLDGVAWSSAAQRGKVVVLNVWGSWCGPCVKEAPVLEAVSRKLQADKAPVVFMGLNFKESPESAQAFVRAKSLTYPSLTFNGGAALLGLGGKAPTVPTTLLLDGQGRLAARVLGPVSAGTLTALVTDVLASDPVGDRS